MTVEQERVIVLPCHHFYPDELKVGQRRDVTCATCGAQFNLARKRHNYNARSIE